jgi:3-mercaptopyruvate sulfurtransferase SseA
MPGSPRLLVRVIAIAVAGAGLGLAVNPLTPRPARLGTAVYPASASGAATCSAHAEPAPPVRISQQDAKQACEACSAAFVDARGESAFAEGHIPGAFHLPPSGHPDETALLQKLRGYREVIVYDDDVGCKLAAGVAQRLKDDGLDDVRVLDGSWVKWLSSGGPAESGACEMCGQRSKP